MLLVIRATFFNYVYLEWRENAGENNIHEDFFAFYKDWDILGFIFDFEYIVGDPDGPGGEINRWKDGKFKGLDNLRFHSLFSRWYSAMKVNHI